MSLRRSSGYKSSWTRVGNLHSNSYPASSTSPTLFKPFAFQPILSLQYVRPFQRCHCRGRLGSPHGPCLPHPCFGRVLSVGQGNPHSHTSRRPALIPATGEISSAATRPQACVSTRYISCNSLAELSICSRLGIQLGNSSPSAIGGLAGVVIPASELVGLNCSPLSILAFKGGECTQQAICCKDTSYVSLVFF